MTDPTATLLAAVIAAAVAGLGLVWSVISFAITRRTQRATDARQEWSRRFEHAHALALSTDLKEAATGLKLIEALASEKWVTDEDRATALSILSSFTHAIQAPAAELRATILADVTNPAVAAELAKVTAGAKGRFELYRDGAGDYRWRLKAADGQFLAVSEGHATERAALNSMELARRELGNV
ncbi:MULTISPECIES: DUF1508 domain-containing protein [unclassified Microbacterium]|uniref:YegP family protein n=1 Tax=unclassified Microbacterium TaxID=2609290 RepID=UPI000EA8BDDB|nr:MULTISPECIES: DUF1508 domain-containing protein [unclassified Microbacterium]MBT2483878.1 DUF1508 domain-containing protein [Microbacterium sp. ISL-108]RKN66859.1 DUF1508 domain-containing protein [Microbacterium sp. CGR2]